MDFLVRHRDLRSHPANLLPGTRTVICVLLSYKSDSLIHTFTHSHIHAFPLVAQYAYPPDYHDRLRSLLHTLAARLREAYPGMECRPCVDSAPLPEKYWAVRAGLGWRGRNTLLVNPTFGTFCNLGELLVTLPADRYDTPLPNGCPDGCHACIKACPNGALQHTPSPLRGTPPNLGGEPKKPAPAHSSPKLGEVAQRAGGVCSTLTADRCTAYHTIENRDPELPADLDTAGYAFGCDLCQLACPYNRTAPARYHLTPERRAELESLATADEEQFHRVTRGTPMSRIKYSQWLRNLAKLAP